MPGGVSSPVRAYQAVGGTPIAVDEAQGAQIQDVDGDTYIDLVSAYGAIALGHGHPRVAEACRKAAEGGLNTGMPDPRTVRLAERLVDARPGADWVRFVNSGTEAVMSAIRVARGGHEGHLVLKFAGCYHGHWDPLLVEAGSGVDVFGEGKSAGVPGKVTDDTAVLELDDEDALDRFFDEHGEDTAAAVIEPVAANAGLLPQREAFLQRLRERCTEAGTALVFDEIVTGFRYGAGGIAERTGVTPDLVTLGKTIGGGLPIGAFGGQDAYRELVSPEGPVYQAGTASGNRIATAAGNAVLDEFEAQDAPSQLARTAEALAEAGSKALEPIGARVRQDGPLCWVTFHPEPLPRRSGTMTDEHREAYGRLHRAARDEGLLLPPSPVECVFPTLAFDEDTVETVARRLARAAENVEAHP